MHIGHGQEDQSGCMASKTEAVFFPGPRETQQDGDTSNFVVANGWVSFTTEFKYLSSITHSSLRSDADVNYKITKATAAFGALKQCFFSKMDSSHKDKGTVYVALCLTVLLYGSECWSLTGKLFSRLRAFHAKCVRAMCRVTMQHTRKHRISTASLLKRLEIKHLDYYYNTRLLRWAGHIARMPMYRLPRKFLTSWVDHPRPIGAAR